MRTSKITNPSSLRKGLLHALSLFITLSPLPTVTAQTTQSGEEYAAQADALVAQGRLDQAIAAYDKAINLIPDSSSLYYKRGRAWFAKRLKVEIKADQLNNTLTFKESIQKQFRESLDKAITDFTTAIKLDPTFAGAYVFRGAAKEAKGEEGGALEDYNRAITISPKSSDAYYTRGLFKQKRKEYQSALEDFNKAISLEPKQAGYYAGRGLLLLRMGRESEASSDFNQCLLLDSKWKPILDRQIESIKAEAKKP